MSMPMKNDRGGGPQCFHNFEWVYVFTQTSTLSHTRYLAHGGAARAVTNPNFYGSGHPAESCVTVIQWGLKSIATGRPAWVSNSADGGKASPLELVYSHFERILSYDFLGIFTSHKSKGRCGKTSTGWFYGIKIYLIINRVGGPKLRRGCANMLHNRKFIRY